MLKNVLYFSGSILVFFIGMVIYGVILNIREVTLAEAMEENGLKSLSRVNLVIDRRNYRIELYSDSLLVKSYKAVFGKNSSPIKTSAEDYATPIGEYKICRIDTSYTYYKLLQLNYPNEKIAAEALKTGHVSHTDFLRISRAEQLHECPPDDTNLGSNIGIHGIGNYDFIFKNLPFIFNWTNGSAAVSNENIDEIYSVIEIGTKVRIIN